MLRALLALAAAVPAASWFCDGHALVAALALKSGIMSPATVNASAALIARLVPDYPATGASFAEAACWADDLKASGVAQEANWHFIDLPVCRLADPTACPSPQEDNVVWAIGSAHSTVYSARAAALDRARQLRFLIHFVGDVHQPLHAATLLSAQFPPPAGDRGGNSYRVAGFEEWTTELHALWDGGLGQWWGDLARPLNATGAAWLDAAAARLLAAFPPAALANATANHNVTDWAAESHALAESFVYTAPQAPTPVPADYVARGMAVANERIATAAYRLADLLEYIFTEGALSRGEEL